MMRSNPRRLLALGFLLLAGAGCGNTSSGTTTCVTKHVGSTTGVVRSAWQMPTPYGVRTKLLIVAYVLTGRQFLRPAIRWSGRLDRRGKAAS